MKIGFAGNMNNYPFMLALTLRDMGHEVVFIIDSDERLQRPEFRYPDMFSTWPQWVVDMPGSTKGLNSLIASKQALSILGDCDALIVNTGWPRVARFLKKPYVCILTGSDIDIMADYGAIRVFQNSLRRQAGIAKKTVLSLIDVWRTYRHRLAIRDANGYVCSILGILPNTDRVIRSINPQGIRLMGLMTDVKSLGYIRPPDNKPIKILNAARLNWKMPPAPGRCALDIKRTDILLKGFALFQQKFAGEMRLTLVRKGDDVKETQGLIEDLGIAKYVDWMDEMTQMELLHQYGLHDIISDQFGESIVSMAGLDAMAVGRPLLANWRPEFMDKVVPEKAPICQATSEEHVFQQLVLLRDSAYREEVGIRSRKYVEKYFSVEAVVNRILNVLEPKGIGADDHGI